MAPGLSFFEVGKEDVSAADVLAGRYDDRFRPAPSQPPAFVALRHPLWARVTVRNPGAGPLTRLLVLKQVSLRRLTVYLPTGDGGRYRARVTDATRFIRDTDGRYPHFVYRLTLPPHATRTVYLRVASSNVKFFLSLEAPREYADGSRLASTLAGILFGFVLAVAAYQVALFRMARDRSYWSLVLFALAGLLYEFVKLGYHNVLLGGYAGLFSVGWGLIQCLLASAVVNFSRVFLQSRVRFPRSDRVLFLLQYGVLLAGVLNLLAPVEGAFAMQLLVVLGTPVVLATAVRAVLRGVDHAGTYLVGWVPVVAAGLYTALSAAGLTSSRTMEFMLVPAAVTLSLFVFAFAVANRIGTERLERHALRRERSRLTGILDASPVAVLAVREDDGEVVFANREAVRYFEATPGALTSAGVETLFTDAAEQRSLFERVRQEGEIRDHELTMRGTDGNRFHGLLSIRPIQFGGEAHLLVWVYDITQRKEAEEQLRVAKRESDRANRAKSDFLAMISHEIRTPMNSVLGMVQLLLRSSLDERQRRHTEILHRSGRSLLTLLNDLLDLSRVEAGRLPLQQAPFSPREVVEKVVELTQQRAGEKGLRLATALEPGLPDGLLGDGNRVRQVLLNLVSNAVKFTDAGEVEIRMGAASAGAGRWRLVTSVRDTGPGVPEAFRHELFEAFTRAPVDDVRAREGSWLGLAICRRLVDAMGGTLGFEGEPDGGSRFWFSIELPEAEHVADPERARVDGGAASVPRDILVAEDLEANQQVILGMLELGGHRVTMVGNGAEAVSAARRRPYDVILMDLHMPVMDGVEAARAIRAGSEGPCADVPIVAMTANLMEEGVKACLDAGMNHVLGKPIDLELLDAILAGPVATDAPRVQAAPTLSDERFIDHPKLWNLVKSLSDVEREAQLGKCRQAMEEARQALAEALAKRQWETVRQQAHQMKGLAGLYGFSSLARHAAAFDDWRGAIDEGTEPVENRVHLLSLVLQKTVEALRAWP